MKIAVRRVLSTHIIKVHSISDLDFKLAKAFLGSRAVQSLSRDDTVELRKRLTILEKRRGGTQRSVAVSSEPKVAGQTKEPVDDAKMKSVA